VDIQNRLDEIRNTSLQSLSEGAVLALLQERTILEKSLHEEQLMKEAAEAAAAKIEDERLAQEQAVLEEQRKQETLIQETQTKIEDLSAAIHPDQSDEELLRIIAERKKLEHTLKTLVEGGTLTEEPVEDVPAETLTEQAPENPSAVESVVQTFSPLSEANLQEKTTPEGCPPEEPVVVDELPVTKIEPPVSDNKITIDVNATYTESHLGDGGKASGLVSEEGRIELDPSLDAGEYQGYLSELKANLSSLGSFLQSLPSGAKKNKAFMLEVARIDPAYAMHYADKESLKKDPAFNVRIAGMNNTRNTGNQISEMLPDMRTSEVVLAGVKNDFRNVRFLLPEMEHYVETLLLAQKGALEALKTLKNAHDVEFLIPPILQKDKKFMEEVKKITDAL
jgi:hypothetical protein